MKGLKIATFIILCICIVSADDIFKDFEEIVKDYGYPFEQHYVTTSDGYNLKLFRIQHGIHGLNETSQSHPTNGNICVYFIRVLVNLIGYLITLYYFIIFRRYVIFSLRYKR